MKYLRNDIKFEPLIWQWYAWPYLINPLTAGCNVIERHLKIMKSFVENPQLHFISSKDSRLIGGPFADLDKSKVDDIKKLIDKTNKDCSEIIQLAQEYKNFDNILIEEAHGDSLENLYDKIPEILKGCIELVYDINNNPSIRVIENLLYKKYYNSKYQALAVSECKADHRNFLLSTPRLEDDNEQFFINIPFSDKRLDQLFKMKSEEGEFGYIANLLEIPNDKQDEFENIFTSSEPAFYKDRNFTNDGIRIRYFGHACLLIETKNTSILFDPVISYSTLSEKLVDRFTYEDLPDKIDYVVFTHNHQDHVLIETLLQIRYKIKNVVVPQSQVGSIIDPSMKLILEHLGFCSIIELKEFEHIIDQDYKIISLPFLGEHSDLNIQSKAAYCVIIGNKKMFFAADSRNLDSRLYNHIFNEIGDIDILYLGMECDGAPLTWLYGPLLTKPLKRSYDKNRTLSGSDFEKAWYIANKSNCKEAYIYAMGQEPWLNYIMGLNYSKESPQIIESDKFIKACLEKGVKSERLFGKKEWLISN